jgi:integrase/recombinase XerD
MKTLEVLDLVLKGKRLKANSQKNYRMAFGSLARFSEEFPSDSMVINQWLASLNGLSDGSVRLWFSLVNAAGKYVKKLYKLPNPCEDAERPRVTKKRRRYFSVEELVAIVRACKDEYELLLILTLIDSACRIGELVGLRGRDVGDGFIDVQGKTGQRRYRLDGRICDKLRLLAGGEDEPVFRYRFGGFHHNGGSLGHRVKAIAQRAGLTGVRLGPHTIRHTSASLLADETKQVLLVKALLQHDDIQTSMRYIHDAEDLVIKDKQYSPLQILGKRAKGGVSGKLLGSPRGEGKSMALVPVAESGLTEVEDASLVEDMFPVVKEGIAVRVVLRSGDLCNMRDAFVFRAKYSKDGQAGKASALMRRMLRKGGRERYSRK